MEKITEERIEEAKALVVYVADGADAETQIGRVSVGSAEKYAGAEPVFEEKYCRVYYLR